MTNAGKPRPTVNLLQELVQRDLDTLQGFRLNEKEVEYLTSTLNRALRTNHGLPKKDG